MLYRIELHRRGPFWYSLIAGSQSIDFVNSKKYIRFSETKARTAAENWCIKRDKKWKKQYESQVAARNNPFETKV